MKPYFQDKHITIYHGDCRDMLPQLPDNSIDLVATDPPYGIGFMGKDWDKALPDKQIWVECHRVLKPGAFAFVMSIPRADCLSRMIISLEDAGFWVNFTPIFWAYASGFPKAQNIGKAVDKRLGAEREKGKLKWRASNQLGTMNDDDWQPKDVYDETQPATPQAKALDGSYGGFQPKPAVEVIIVAMKPLSEKTFVDQALKNRKGITWLDEGRIPYESQSKPSVGGRHNIKGRRIGAGDTEFGFQSLETPEVNNKGRFPANLLVSDDVLNDGRAHIGTHKQNPTEVKGQFYGGGINDGNFDGGKGSFSRYFDLDAWFAEKIKQLPKSVQKTFPFLIVPKASKSEKNKGLDSPNIRGSSEQFDSHRRDGIGELRKPLTKNAHPTVKPLKLMSYLITLDSRSGDTILDPFLGSGTTALACQLFNRKCIGIEIEEKYCEIAANRCRQGVMELKI